jgi:hypothetical protein
MKMKTVMYGASLAVMMSLVGCSPFMGSSQQRYQKSHRKLCISLNSQGLQAF